MFVEFPLFADLVTVPMSKCTFHFLLLKHLTYAIITVYKTAHWYNRLPSPKRRTVWFFISLDFYTGAPKVFVRMNEQMSGCIKKCKIIGVVLCDMKRYSSWSPSDMTSAWAMKWQAWWQTLIFTYLSAISPFLLLIEFQVCFQVLISRKTGCSPGMS